MNSEGQEVVMLSADKDGNGGTVIFNKDGKVIGSLS